VTTKGDLWATDITHIKVANQKAGNPCPPFKPLFFCLLWYTQRSRVRDDTKVLVEVFRDKVQVLRLECLTAFEEEFGLE
jgi:hypothetical protein